MKYFWLSCIGFVLLAACNPSAATATAIPTPTELPSTTQIQSPISTFTPAASPTPSGPQYCVTTNLLNLRNGPGIDYNIVTILAQNTCGPATARNEDSTWAYIATAKYAGWAYVKYLTITGGDISNLRVNTALTAVTPVASQTPSASSTTTP
jgi:uncharacterized protein YgiM (DUF1202 family)